LTRGSESIFEIGQMYAPQLPHSVSSSAGGGVRLVDMMLTPFLFPKSWLRLLHQLPGGCERLVHVDGQLRHDWNRSFQEWIVELPKMARQFVDCVILHY